MRVIYLFIEFIYLFIILFIEVTNKFGYPEIDLLATKINTQLQNYVFRSCKPEAKAVDAFLTDWG